jgi:DNA sulfur modification protein DndD
MIIRRVEIQNFRPFYGLQNLDLRPESGRPLTLIRALNDVGKTSLFTALRFCLYGERRPQLAKLINRTAAVEADGQMFVRMLFDHDASQYEIARVLEYRKGALPTEEPIVRGDDTVSIIKDGVIQNLRSVEQQNEFIEAILPFDASRFFFFDGEQIQVYTKHPPEERVREAIEIVLGIRELLNARDDLQHLNDEYRRDLNRLLKEKSRDEDESRQLEVLEAELRQLKDDIEQLTDRIAETRQVVSECDAILERAAEIREKVVRRKILEAELERSKQDIETVINEQRLFNRYAGPLLLAPVLEIVCGPPERHHSRPAVWKREAAKHVLVAGECICGRPITEECTAVLKAAAETETKTFQDLLRDSALQLLRSLEPRSRERDLVGFLERHLELEAKRRDFKTEHARLHEELRAFREEDIKRTEDVRSKAQVDLERSEEQRRTKLESVRRKEAELDARQARLANRTISVDVQRQQRILETCRAARDAIHDVIDRLVASRRAQVEELASDVFRKLTNNPALYEGIVIDTDYSLKIKTVGGITRPVWIQEPSAGASQIIATAFIAALNRYTAREAPVVIDTPIGRLDPIHKRNLLEFLPEFGPQVLILYQPEELDDGDVGMLKPAVNAEWEIGRSADRADTSQIRKRAQS